MSAINIFSRLACCRSNCWLPTLNQIRGSKYGPSYLEPTVDKSELSKPLADSDPRKYQPIKAARSQDTTSANHDDVFQKFINMMMESGNKGVARDVLDRTYATIKIMQLEKYHQAQTQEEKDAIIVNPHIIFNRAVDNCKPVLETCKVVKAGVMYHVPISCKPDRQVFRSMRWLIGSCRGKAKDRKVRFYDRLARELIDAAQNEGVSIRKKQELHKFCESNRAYAHYRWSR